MKFTDVCIETVSNVLPPQVVTSADLEARLKPVYDRLRLPEGRLELMTGIRERRFWHPETLPSQAAAEAGSKALKQAGLSPEKLGLLAHCSVSRDFAEPATSTSVHRLMDLPGTVQNFDLSNACLGVLSGMVVAANMIQTGAIEAALLVTGENSLPLVESTIRSLLSDETLTRKTIKPYFASLTIGSAAAAVLLTHKSISKSGHRLLGGATHCNTRYNDLCQGDVTGGMSGDSHAVMETDSEELLKRGNEVASQTWQLFKEETGWDETTPDTICTHQVGAAHRKLLFETLSLDDKKNFSTFEFTGNCGSASLPATAALAEESGVIKPGRKVAWLGIGSGINCTMLAVEW